MGRMGDMKMNEKKIPDLQSKDKTLKQERNAFLEPLLNALKDKGYSSELGQYDPYTDQHGREVYAKNSPFPKLEWIMLSTFAAPKYFRVRIQFTDGVDIHEMRGRAYTSNKFDRGVAKIKILKLSSGVERKALDFFIPKKDILGDEPNYETAQKRILDMVMVIHALYE